MGDAPDRDGQSIEFYRLLSEPKTHVIVVVDADLKVRWVSRSSEWILGRTWDDMIGEDALDLVHPDDHDFALSALGEGTERVRPDLPVIARGTPVRVITPDGPVWFDVGADFRMDDPAVEGFVLRVKPAPAQPLLDEFLARSMSNVPADELLEPLVDLMEFETPGSMVMFAHDWDGVQFHEVISPRPSPLEAIVTTKARFDQRRWPWAEAMINGWYKCAEAEELAPDLAELMDECGFTTVWAHPTMPDGPQPSCVITWRVVPGEPWQYHAAALQRISRLAALAIERREHEHRLTYAATRDALTGLLNRRAFYDALQRRSDASSLGVLFLDLDGFKPVNDELGHDAGDQVLRNVAQRIEESVRPDDISARLGGDEFAIILAPPCTPEVIGAIAERIMRAITEPMQTDKGEVTIGVSVGAASRALDTTGALASDASSPRSEPSALVVAADHAMYRVKQAGGNRWLIDRAD